MLKALGNFILAVPEEETQTAGGFLLPEELVRQFHKARVLSVGESVKVPVKEGDGILITGDNKKLKFESKDYYLIKEESLALKLTEE